ncbi:hypothetical protein CAC42_880 [Sphaceloma murrayae]|uniref:THO complex subunit 2 n=1 Tax=Sphaceloma murrayae TaxID=2082308 RepID=A0A2K1QKX9_9PEZI|nr:hypothetical protein CAC42_880 [Sphaceloma murrayae]
MAPVGKRKRPDRSYTNEGGRPSPHRPESLNMAHHGPRGEGRGGFRGDTRRRGLMSQSSQFEGQRRTNANADAQSTPSHPHQTPRSPVANPGRPQSSTPATPMARIPPPRQSLLRQPSPPLEEEGSYEYQFVTQDIASGWADKGRDQLQEAIQQIEDMASTGIWIQELVRSAVRRRIDPKEAGELFHDACTTMRAQCPEIPVEDIFIDTVALTSSADWKRSSLSNLVFHSGIAAETWHLALETDCIEALGMSREKFTRQKTRLITNHLYRQSNYNLLREESEGYAKLITEYFNIAQNASATDSPPTLALDAFKRVKALVGSFDLDVGRVLDITLDVFANLLVRNFRFFVKFTRASTWWPELVCPNGIKWIGQGFDTLPDWALPDSHDWGVGQEEVDRIVRLQPLIQDRDIKFWQEVQETGMAAYLNIGSKRIVNFEDEAVQQILNTELEAKDDDKDRNGVEKNKIKRVRTNDQRKWMRTTRTIPPLGNPDAANILGFKLAFYSSPARDKNDIMPDNLIFLTALLIKIGFISLRDLYPHLYPPDDRMAEVKARLEKEVEERELANRPGGGPNKLAMSGALPDDTAPAIPVLRGLRDPSSSKANSPKPESLPKTESDTSEQLPEPQDQKIALLKSLLVIGAIPEAMFILGRFPWLADLVPDFSRYVHRILHHMLSKVYESVRPMNDREDLTNGVDQTGDSVGMPKGSLKRHPAPPRRPKRWATLDEPDQGDGVSYKFYWDDWTDNVPMCQTIDDVFLLCGTFLNLSGVRIGQDPTLLLKLARIGKQSLAEDRSVENESRWIDLLKRLLVPALSLTSKNPAAANEIFDILRLFPTSTRYSIYAEWHFGPTARLPDMKRAFDRTRLEAKDVLKRISKTNMKPMGKALAKVAFGSPGIVLQTAINQMESYENLIEVFVECSRYFTFLGYDVLTWCLLNALGGNSRSRIQSDGMLTSSWLRSLSTFAGAIYKRYSMCDPTPVLHYIASELRNGNSTDLELLEQMIVAMAGIKSDMAFNEAQTLAMAGGDLLQAQTLKQMADERHKNEKTSKRFLKALTDSGLAGQLLILVAQERQMYTSRKSASAAPLKVLGNNVDKIHQVMIQYLEAFRSNASVDAFAAAVPGPTTLMTDFGLDAEIAFMIGRVGIAREVSKVDAQRKADLQEKARLRSAAPALANGDVQMDGSGTVSAGRSIVGPREPSDIEMDEVTMEGSEAQPAANSIETLASASEIEMSTKTDQAHMPWHPSLTDLIEAMPSILGNSVASTLSVPFYVTFWTLSLQDIVVNTSSYNQELAHQTSLANQIKNDRSDQTSVGIRERDRKIKAINELKDKLGEEMKSQIGAYTQVRERLTKEKDHWFTNFHNKIVTLATSLLQNCFLPRVLLSPLDAHYTFTMIKFLHNNGTPHFRTMHIYDQLFKKNLLTSLIFGATAREAENLGRFLYECLKDLRAWHSDAKTYEKNAWGTKKQLAGFVRNVRDGGVPHFLDYEEFRTLLFKWHTNMRSALSACLDSQEYMHIRNAIIVLKGLLPQFPVINFTGHEMIKKVTNISEKDGRGDLKLAALSLLGSLKPLEKDFMLVQQFHMAKQPHPADMQGSNTPQTSSNNPNLNAEAPEFRPTISLSSTKAQHASAGSTNDAEDGEIDDEKNLDAGKSESMDFEPAGTSQRPDQVRSTPVQVPIKAVKNAPETRDIPRALPTTAVSNSTVDGARSPHRSRIAHDKRSESLPPRPDSRLPGRQEDRAARTPSNLAAGASDTYGRLDRPSDLGRVPNRPELANGRRDVERATSRSQGRDQMPTLPQPSYESRDAPTGPATSVKRTSTHNDPRDTSGEITQRRRVNGATEGVPSTPAEAVNPARLALIQGSQQGASSPSARDGRGTSRASSPRRDDKSVQSASAHGDRLRSSTQYLDSRAHDRFSEQTPTRPRRDEMARAHSSDLFERVPSRPGSSAPSRQIDPSFGRLNGPEVPAGPRVSTISANTPMGAPQSRNQAGHSPNMPSQPFAQTRNGTRPLPNSSQAPVTPAREPGSGDAAQSANVHPSRRTNVDPIDTKGARSALGHPVGPSSATPTGPSPSTRAPPTGPMPSGSRSDRRFAGLNDALQGSPNQGAQIRGRAVRVNSTSAPTGPASSNGAQQMPPPTTATRPADPSRLSSGRGTRPAEQAPLPSPTAPRSAFEQRSEYGPSRDNGRTAPRSGPNSRDPSRDPAVREDRRAEYRGGSDPDPRARPSRDDYRDYREADVRGGYPREDPYGRGAHQQRPSPGYAQDSRYPPADPYGTIRRPMDEGRAPPPEYRGPTDGRAPYGAAAGRVDPRDDRNAGWDRRDDGRDLRKRRAEDMIADPTKRRRSGQ